MDLAKVPYHSIGSLGFSVYRQNELKRLSVLEVTNLETFDALGHPTHNGLYDAALGPCGRDEPCATCGLNQATCPGHIGHISFPLPIFNPVFFKNLYQLLKGSCFSCHGLLAPPAASELLLAQLKVLDYGLVSAVQQLEELALEAATKKVRNAIQLTSELKERLNSAVEEFIRELQHDRDKSSVRNVVECRLRITKRFVQEHMMKPGRKCAHCGSIKSPIAVYQNTNLVFTDGSHGNAAPSKKKQEDISLDPPNMDDLEESILTEERSCVGHSYLTPLEARKHVTRLFEEEKPLLTKLFGILHDTSPADIFFLDALLVPPSRFRPLSYLKGKTYENPQTTALNKVLVATATLGDLIKCMKINQQADEALPMKLAGKTSAEKLHLAWNKLQVLVNCIMDSDLDRLHQDKTLGIKQVLEKKDGLFRKNMMGKRVNFAARSVISPDPYIMVEEVGIPTVFATRLTYPQPVTPWNVRELRRAVKNGPDKHPGAALVEEEDGTVVRLLPGNPLQREAIAKQLLTPSSAALRGGLRTCKIVHRHIRNGDVVLLNRQPTLHRPSIMAHKVRVLPGEKTLRLHYANCKCYNADFDGDEMNCHLPQSELARAEAYSLANVGNQYLVPKDGTPLAGLIQDHVVAGTLLTLRGRFFTRDDYQQLVYGALTFSASAMRLLPPSILRPCTLWSGKQVVSTIIMNLIPRGKPLPFLEGKTKTDEKHFQSCSPRRWCAGGTPFRPNEMSESWVVIRSGELLTGVLDKAHFGPTQYGLVHVCYELYGGETSSLLLTALARLFTHFLQIHKGFTLGVEDILLVTKSNRKREKVIEDSLNLGEEASANALGVPTERLPERLREAHCSREGLLLKQLDGGMKSCTDGINNRINKACMPRGLWKMFPENNLQLMVQSGSKGAMVNCMQISCLLGQIELEGRRVPLMMSGKTLPSFVSYDTSPRSGGFVSGRFLTGIRPQEFFFHCMAGREGLVDTAVKTSHSGYLQRCLIKHMEGLMVNYDMTVRDCDGSVVQFQYGEDGLDVGKQKLLTPSQFPLMLQNHLAVVGTNELEEAISRLGGNRVRRAHKAIAKWNSNHENLTSGEKIYNSAFLQFAKGNMDALLTTYSETDNFLTFADAKRVLQDMWFNLEASQLKRFERRAMRRPDPIVSHLRPDLNLGAITERLDRLVEDYLEANPNASERFRSVVHYKALRSLCHPGEAVGLLAAQSVGEPSTQMTLNTFHFAGRGEMNVTLGIPRLREILMTASANISTPSMDLPLKLGAGAKKLRRRLTAVCLAEVLEEVQIGEILVIEEGQKRCRKYVIKFVFLPREAYKDQFSVRPAHILHYVERTFVRQLCASLKRKLTMLPSSRSLRTRKSQKQEEAAAKDISPPPPDEESSEEEGGDGDTTSTGQRTKHEQECEYEEPEEGEQMPEEEFLEEEAIVVDAEDVADDTLSKPDVSLQRVESVVAAHDWISEYTYDTSRELWCTVTLQMPVVGSKLDMASVVETEARKAFVTRIDGIRRAFVLKGGTVVKTEGVNFLAIFGQDDLVDVRHIYSNDIHAIARTYGIEAGARAIAREVTNVFGAYGIEVDPRHLLLLADYMTCDGTIKGCNRNSIECCPSPLQQMTFETTLNFLRSATIAGVAENLKSPSSRLVLGKVVTSGTGCFDLLQRR